jgi:hypothetical protein
MELDDCVMDLNTFRKLPDDQMKEKLLSLTRPLPWNTPDSKTDRTWLPYYREDLQSAWEGYLKLQGESKRLGVTEINH